MTLSSSDLFAAIHELRGELHSTDAIPVVTALLTLHTVRHFENHFAELGVHLPEEAIDLSALQLPLETVYSALRSVIGDRLELDVDNTDLFSPNLDDARVARASRKVSAYVIQESNKHADDKCALNAIGQSCTHLLDYSVRQFPSTMGAFQTPGSLAQSLASLLNVQPGMSLLDPACGLARTFVEVARAQEDPNAIRYCGQENVGEVALQGALHLILNGVTNFLIQEKDALAPHTQTTQFDRVVGDPPIGQSYDQRSGELQGDPRFVFGGEALPKSADWLYLQHGLTALRPGGRAVFISAHGPMFRGGIEAAIRKDILTAGWLNSVVALPSALYPNLALPLVLTVFERPESGLRNLPDVLMADVSSKGTREGRIQVLPDEVKEDLCRMIEMRQPTLEYATLVSPSRIFGNKDAWQPNQYLDQDISSGHDLSALLGELNKQKGNLKEAQRELEKAFGALPTVSS